jgi:broad specificity phosphatase PhoE
MPFEEYLPKTLPPWLRGPWGTKFHASVGKRMDVIVERYRQAGFTRLPLLAAANGDDEALAEIGHDRQLPRGPGESAEAYGDRLWRAWEAWAGDNTPGTGVGGGAGSHLGMLNAIAAAGMPTGPTGATIVQQNGRWAQLDVGGNLVLGTLMDCVNRMDLTDTVNPRPGWTFEGRPNFYSAFGIVFPEPATIDTAALNGAVAKWKPSKALYIGAWVIGAASQTLGWPTGRTLGTEPNLGGNTVTFYPGATRDDLRIGYYAI